MQELGFSLQIEVNDLWQRYLSPSLKPQMAVFTTPPPDILLRVMSMATYIHVELCAKKYMQQKKTCARIYAMLLVQNIEPYYIQYILCFWHIIMLFYMNMNPFCFIHINMCYLWLFAYIILSINIPIIFIQYKKSSAEKKFVSNVGSFNSN